MPDALPHLTPSIAASSEWHRRTIQEQGYHLTHHVFGASRPSFARQFARQFDGLLIGDDMMTSGAMVAFRKLGIRVGQDIMLATGANAGSPILFGYENILTRIEIDSGAIVRALFDLLDALMSGRPPEPPSVSVTPTIRSADGLLGDGVIG